MKSDSGWSGRLLVVVALLVAATLVVSTSGADVVSHHETDVLELEPVGEGTYAQIDDDTGEIKIVLTEENPNVDGEGLNDDAVTDVGPVFRIENVLEQQREATVWIDHGSEAVEFYAPGEGAIESEEQGVTLQPGESITVALRIDTRGTDELTLNSIAVLAKLVPQGDTPDEAEDPGAAPGDPPRRGGAEETPTVTPTITDTPTATPTTTPTVTHSPASPPSDPPEGRATETSARDDTDSSTVTARPEEEAGLDPWLLGGVVAVVGAAGGGLLLTRRLGYL